MDLAPASNARLATVTFAVNSKRPGPRTRRASWPESAPMAATSCSCARRRTSCPVTRTVVQMRLCEIARCADGARGADQRREAVPQLESLHGPRPQSGRPLRGFDRVRERKTGRRPTARCVIENENGCRPIPIELGLIAPRRIPARRGPWARHSGWRTAVVLAICSHHDRFRQWFNGRTFL